MNYLQEIKQLVQDGRGGETAEMLDKGMQAVGKEVAELANRHPGDWPIVITVLRLAADNMESSLPVESRMLMALLSTAFTADAKITRTAVDGAELKRQMEGMEHDG